MRHERQNILRSGNVPDGSTPAAGFTLRPDICLTHLQSDEPALDDAFGEFGSHQRIAEAIAELILMKNGRGISIGVEGSWGSGKTTVARLLRKILEDDQNINVITFDAWAHEGDPLRRTFIESIIRHLQQQGWVKEEPWNERIEEIANRREVVSTRDTVVLSGWGKLFALSLLMVPAGGSFLTAALRENFTFAATGTLAYKFLLLLIVGLILSLAPFLIILFTLRNKDVLGLLINKGSTEKRTETSKTANPTSIEFENTFDSLMDEALADEERRLVMILDNLDRVDSKDALTIWSTLQTFLQHKSDEQRHWRKRLWILVLYDMKGLQLLWQRGDSEPHEGGAAKSFMDKSFQIRFEVPALVLSDWREFLMQRLKESFPRHEESEFHEVYRVLAIQLSKNNRLPTIRELKLYVNQIGSIHRQWAAGEKQKNGGVRQKDAFPLSHIAYYVLLRRENEDVLDKLSKQEIPSREYHDLLGSEVTHNLAAMGFNVEVNEAQQLLFSNRIKDALGRGSSADLRKLASLPKGFWEMLEKFITTEWAGSEAVNIADAALALNDSELLGRAPQPAERTVIKKMCDIAYSVGEWTTLDEKTAYGLAVLIKWKSNLEPDSAKLQDFLDTLFRAVARGLIGDALRSDTTLDARQWLERLGVPLKQLQPNLRIQALQTIVGAVAAAIRNTPKLNYSRFHELLLEVLSELANNHADADSAASSLVGLINEGHVDGLLRQDESRTGSSVAWGMYLLFRYAPDLDDNFISAHDRDDWREIINSVSSDPSGAAVEKFVKILERYKQLHLLFGNYARLPEVEPFTLQALRIILKSPDAYSLFMRTETVDNLEYVFKVMGQSEDEVKTLDELVTRLLKEKPGFIDDFMSSSFKVRNARFYQHALRTGKDHDLSSFKKWCLMGLQQVSIEKWEAQLKDGGELLSLAFSLKEKGTPVNLGHNYFVAVANKAMEILKSPDTYLPPPLLGENLAELLGPVASNARTDLSQQLCFLLDKANGNIPAKFFQFMGAELRRQLMHGPPGENVLNIFPAILKGRNVAGLNWIKSTLVSHSLGISSKYAEDARIKEFKEGIRTDLVNGHHDSTLTPEAQMIVHDIAELMKISPSV